MELREIPLPSVVAYANALSSLDEEDRIKDNQRELLRLHHAARARVTTATRLAELIEFESYSGVNLQYGLLAQAIAERLGYPDLEFEISILVEFVEVDQVANQEILWALRPNVAVALEALGWVPPTSDLLYPHLTTS